MSTNYSIVIATLLTGAASACGPKGTPKTPPITSREASSYPADGKPVADDKVSEGEETQAETDESLLPPAKAQGDEAPAVPAALVAAAMVTDPHLFVYRVGSKVVFFSTSPNPRSFAVLQTEAGVDVSETKPELPQELGEVHLGPGHLFAMPVTRPASGCHGECRIAFNDRGASLGEISLDAANVDDIKGRTFPGLFDRTATTLRLLPQAGPTTLRFRTSGPSSLGAPRGLRLRQVQSVTTTSIATVTTDGDFLEVTIASAEDALKLTLEQVASSPQSLDYFEVSVKSENKSLVTYYLSSLPTLPPP